MTWGEWLDSSYNTIDYSGIYEDQVYVGEALVRLDGDFVTPTDEIQASAYDAVN